MHWRAFQTMQRLVELAYRYVSYVDEGSGDPVVLLHGIPTWGYLWHGVMPDLAPTHRVLIPDLLGFGYSDKRDRFDRSIARQAEMIEAWMAALAVERASIVGHDIGGGVALRLATLFPQRVARLCVVNTVCYDSWPIETLLQFGHPETRRKLSASTAMARLKQALTQGFAMPPADEVLDGLLAPYSTVDALREWQVFVHVTGIRVLRIRTDGEILLSLPFQNTFAPRRIVVPPLYLMVQGTRLLFREAGVLLQVGE
jgi:pimeloyl-ACP methyl ester carboxylesterase